MRKKKIKLTLSKSVYKLDIKIYPLEKISSDFLESRYMARMQQMRDIKLEVRANIIMRRP